MEHTLFVRSFLELQWSNVLKFFGNDEKLTFVLGTSMVILTSFCVANAFFMFLDFTGMPAFFHKYKIQKDKNVPVETRRFLYCCVVSFRNVLTSCGMIYLFYPLMRAVGMSCTSPLPPAWRVLFEYVVFILVDEFFFYYSHRLLHLPALYKHIHKIHHEWVAPISIAAFCTHPVEHLVSNVLPIFAGPVLVGSHLCVAWVWLIMAHVDTCLHHSNYHLPLLSSPQFHDYHHVKFNENFGANGLLDWFHKTDVGYKKSIQYKRHVTYYQLKPITEIFPDDNGKQN